MPSSVDHEVLVELRQIKKLLAVLATKGTEQQRDRIQILDTAGFSPKEIADLLGTTRNSVSVALVKLRKQSRPK